MPETGTGYSTADSQGYVADESQVAADFVRIIKIYSGPEVKFLWT